MAESRLPHSAPVVVSGIGAWTCFGRGVNSLDRATREGRSGVAPISDRRVELFSRGGKHLNACSIDDLSYEALLQGDPTALVAMGRAVARDALNDAGLAVDSLADGRSGLCLGTTLGGGLAFLSHYRAREGLGVGHLESIVAPCTPGAIAGEIADGLGLAGPVSAISTACASGANAIGRGLDLIRAGRVDLMLVGGLDLYSELSVSGFNALQALAAADSRPFQDDRDGLILGDGAAVLVLESLESALGRGREPYAELGGYATANEAFHATGPDPSGSGALRVMAGALSASGLDPSAVGYINAHGTGTRANDAMEAVAIRKLFHGEMDGVRISSTKPATGHTLGAAGAVEAAITCLAIRHQYVPTTSLKDCISSEFADLPIVRGPVEGRRIYAAMSNSFGFGGNVASLAFIRTDDPPRGS